MISFEDLQKKFPRALAINYADLKFCLDIGIDVWEFSETLTLAAVIRDHGTPAQTQRLREEIIAGRWAQELYLEDERAWMEATMIRRVGTTTKARDCRILR